MSRGLKIWIVIISVILVVFSSSLVYYLTDGFGSRIKENKTYYQEIEIIELDKQPAPYPEILTFTTTFFGDVFWGRYVDDWSKASELGNNYPFSGLNTFQKQKYEYWIANLECPVTTTYIPSFRQDSTLKFSCPPDYVKPASEYFDVFSLANNHTDNMEEVDGFKQTKQFLEEENIEFFGHFDNKLDEVCKLIIFEANPVFKDTEKEILYNRLADIRSKETKTLTNNIFEYQYKVLDTIPSKVPIVLCGYHNVFRLPTTQELEVIKSYSQYFPVVTMPHQGKEYITQPDNFQKDIFRQMIDLGASAVMGGHTHSILPIEEYQDSLIAYSLGNFIFDQQFNQMVTTGLGVRMSWVIDLNELNLSILNSYQDCKPDDCLIEATEKGINKLVSKNNYEYVISDSNNKLTKKATGEREKYGLDILKNKTN